jgi:uncharacterized membrane protein
VSTVHDTRLYGAVIALASGVYSVVSAFGSGMGMMPMSDSVMLLVGIAGVAHGIALLTPLANRLGSASGPLMILWAAIMLANQGLSAMTDSMTGPWDGGMVALALLMLVSGAIMSLRRDSM